MCPSFGHGMLTQTRAFTHIPHLACHIIMHELKNIEKTKKTNRSANLTTLWKYINNFHTAWPYERIEIQNQRHSMESEEGI